jgi:ribosomal protein L19E
MKREMMITAALIAVLTASVAQAGTRDPGVNQRQRNQSHRIGEGVRSGELTRPEARALRAEQRAIRLEEREFKADGKLTRGERRELHRDLNEASRDIYREKHDADRRN